MWDAGGFCAFFPLSPTVLASNFLNKTFHGLENQLKPLFDERGLIFCQWQFCGREKSRDLIKVKIVRDWGLVPATRRIKAANRVSVSRNAGLRRSHQKPGWDLDIEMKMNTSFLSVCTAVKSVHSSDISTWAQVSQQVSLVHPGNPCHIFIIFFISIDPVTGSKQ